MLLVIQQCVLGRYNRVCVFCDTTECVCFWVIQQSIGCCATPIQTRPSTVRSATGKVSAPLVFVTGFTRLLLRSQVSVFFGVGAVLCIVLLIVMLVILFFLHMVCARARARVCVCVCEREREREKERERERERERFFSPSFLCVCVCVRARVCVCVSRISERVWSCAL